MDFQERPQEMDLPAIHPHTGQIPPSRNLSW